MKKHILVFLLSCSLTFAWSNVVIPRANISEVFIDTNNTWILELGFYLEAIWEVDSIRIETSSGSSMVTYYTLLPGGGEYGNFDSISVINNSNLAEPISINPSGDYVKVISYTFGEVVVEYLAIGNYPGSFLDCAKPTESISYVIYQQSAGYTGSFCIDKSPTIGYGNDTTGALGFFTGQLYDLNGALITNVWFPMPDISNTTIHIDSTGSFSERIFARRYTFDTVMIYIPPWPYANELYTIEMVDFCLEPDASYDTDIITTSLITGTSEQQPTYENTVVIAPNPFSTSITFYINLEDFKISDKWELRIHKQNGSMIERIELPASQKTVDWLPGESLENGLYLYQIIRNHQPVKTGKIIKL